MEDLGRRVLDNLNLFYWRKIREILEQEKQLQKTFPTFLLNPEKIHIYIGKSHIGIEYFGGYKGPIPKESRIEIAIFDFTVSKNFIEEIVGVSFDNGPMNIPLDGINDDIYIATMDATSILAKNNWNFLAQEMIFMVNVSGLTLGTNFIRIRNSFFYEKRGDGLKVRNVKWMDLFPIKRVDVNEDMEEITIDFPNLSTLALSDAHYSLPEKINFQYNKLTILNRFIELYNSKGIIETDITRFLAIPEHQFILTMSFFGNDVHSEKECSWVVDKNRPAIKPDFFVSGTNGYADIVEFKLPYLKTHSAIVGKDNRETFSAEIQSYISQTRTYREYFEDSLNRKYVEETHGIKVYYPKRYLVIGRRWMFSDEVWRSIENDYRDLNIRTYDDIIDTVMGYLMS